MNVKLERAWERRHDYLRTLKAEATDAYRIFGGAPEGIEGLFIDRFGSTVVLTTYPDKCRIDVAEMADECLALSGVTGVYHKPFVADRSRTLLGEHLLSPRPLCGVESPAEYAILEKGVRFLIRPYDGFSVGLFLDQRENRHFLAQGVRGKRVLNLFAYTCGFSVACAGGGAETVSVDISKKHLEWGKRNFETNEISLEPHLFFQEDALQFLQRAKKRGDRYDRVIIDPPTFSRGPRGTFSVLRDFIELIQASLDILSSGGDLFFSTNHSDWSEMKLLERVCESFPEIQLGDLPRLPDDFRFGAIPHVAIRCFKNYPEGR